MRALIETVCELNHDLLRTDVRHQMRLADEEIVARPANRSRDAGGHQRRAGGSVSNATTRNALT
jgi:hypothetical protein